MLWGKGNNQTFWRLLDTGSEMALIPGEWKHLCGPAARVGIIEGQVIYGSLSHSGSSGPPNPLCGYSPTSRTHRQDIIRTDILSSWQNLHFGSLTCGAKAITVGKATWAKSLRVLELHCSICTIIGGSGDFCRSVSL